MLSKAVAGVATAYAPGVVLRDGAVEPRQFGAMGNGLADDTVPLGAAMREAFASGRPLDGGVALFAVRGDLRHERRDAPWIRSLRLRQLDPTNDRKTLHFLNCRSIRIDHLEIDVGRSRRVGYMNASGGLWIDGGRNHRVQNTTVFGHGKNSLIAIWNTIDSSYIDLCARDGAFDDASVTDDVVQGIFLLFNRNCTLQRPRVLNLTGNGRWRGTLVANLRTRGIALGGNERIRIMDPTVANVDQGIDITGDLGNVRIDVVGGSATDCASSGLKFANSAEDCSAVGFRSLRCSGYGFMISGPNAAETHQTQRIRLVDCLAQDTGGLAVTTAGFMVQAGANARGVMTRFPKAVHLLRCRAIDTQAVPRMDYGFYSNVSQPGNQGDVNRLMQCTSSGHRMAARHGAWVNG